jgi:adenylyltransferase/sulfurtransferase
MSVRELSPGEAQAWLSSERPPRLIDVREQEEWDHCRLAGAELIALSAFGALFPLRLHDPAEPLLIYCHHGMRSRRVADFLAERGFTDVANLTGGIEAWSCQVDPAVPRY